MRLELRVPGWVVRVRARLRGDEVHVEVVATPRPQEVETKMGEEE